MTNGELQQILPGKEISDSKDVIPSLPVKPALGIQLAPDDLMTPTLAAEDLLDPTGEVYDHSKAVLARVL